MTPSVKPFFFLLFSFIWCSADAQNLVTNGNFEAYTICPNAISQINYCNGWNTFTSGGSPDYDNTCSASTAAGIPINYGGSRTAASGNAYACVINQYYTSDFREYMHTSLTSPLIPGAIYEASMSVSLGDISAWGSDGLGIYMYESYGSPTVTTWPISTGDVLPVTPQVDYTSYGAVINQTGWDRLVKTFTSDSAYNHIAIGGFIPEVNITRVNAGGSQTYSYYYIDSVVIKIVSPVTINTSMTAACTGDYLTIPVNITGTRPFSSSNVFTLQLSNASGSFASPTILGTLSGNTAGYVTGTIPSTTPAGTGYKIRVVSSSPADSSNATYPLVINSPQTILSSSNTPICEGEPLYLHSSSVQTGVTFNWRGPNNFVGTTANDTLLTTTTAGTGRYILTTQLGACTVKDTVDVLIKPTPVIVAGSNSPVCEGNPLYLTCTSTVFGANFNWTGPLGFTNNRQDPTLVSNTTHNGDFIVRATLNGCVSNTDTTTVLVYPKPYLGNYASPNDTVCQGTVVTFVTVPMSGIINPTFQWFKNNTLVPGATSLTLISPYATGDTFYCRTFCQNQCGDNLTLYSNKVGMTVMPIVNNLSVTLSSVPAQPIPGNPVAFTATVVSGGYSPQYQWKKNGSDIFGATSAIYNANNLAPYDKITCCVITSDPCANPTTACSDAMIVNFPTSVGEINNDEVFQLYPNPNDGSFKVKMQNVKCKSVEVLNVSGQVVYQLKPDTQQTEYTIHMPAQLPSGTYMLRVYDGENYYRKSFSVIK